MYSRTLKPLIEHAWPEPRRVDSSQFVIERDGNFYQDFHLVGFLLEIDGSDPKRASKYPRTIAHQIAAERGGVTVRLAQCPTTLRLPE